MHNSGLPYGTLHESAGKRGAAVPAVPQCNAVQCDVKPCTVT
jgi:hypothetical protein